MIGMRRSAPREAGSVGLRGVRLRARAPRLALYGVLGLLAVAGLRAALAPAREGPPPPAVIRPQGDDLAASSFAEAFARTYLTWGEDEAERERLLAPFLAAGLEPDGGLRPAAGASQQVLWTAVAGAERVGSRTLVVVAVRTTAATLELSVPVERDDRGFLYVSGYPALVGPPASAAGAVAPGERPVEDRKLLAVVDRALRNYLSGARTNLMADLSPDAVVSLPSERLDVRDVGEVTWAVPGRRVAAQVDALDARGTAWTLRYELEVRRRDRWYVRSVQVNPTLEGGN
jgi:Conjugative transposon protein TcpC